VIPNGGAIRWSNSNTSVAMHQHRANNDCSLSTSHYLESHAFFGFQLAVRTPREGIRCWPQPSLRSPVSTRHNLIGDHSWARQVSPTSERRHVGTTALRISRHPYVRLSLSAAQFHRRANRRSVCLLSSHGGARQLARPVNLVRATIDYDGSAGPGVQLGAKADSRPNQAAIRVDPRWPCRLH
jgi:hypothetical protein